MPLVLLNHSATCRSNASCPRAAINCTPIGKRFITETYRQIIAGAPVIFDNCVNGVHLKVRSNIRQMTLCCSGTLEFFNLVERLTDRFLHRKLRLKRRHITTVGVKIRSNSLVHFLHRGVSIPFGKSYTVSLWQECADRIGKYPSVISSISSLVSARPRLAFRKPASSLQSRHYSLNSNSSSLPPSTGQPMGFPLHSRFLRRGNEPPYEARLWLLERPRSQSGFLNDAHSKRTLRRTSTHESVAPKRTILLLDLQSARTVHAYRAPFVIAKFTEAPCQPR